MYVRYNHSNVEAVGTDVTEFIVKKSLFCYYIFPVGFDIEVKPINTTMKQLTHHLFVLTLLALTVLVGCEREGMNGSDLLPDPTSTARTAACNNFNYADTIFFLREQSTPYTESPTTAQTGQYGAFPQGLSINASTGVINVNASETGLKYRVWFVKTGTADTCTRFVTISGVNYLNKVYRLDQNDTLARPFYNAIRTFGPPCSDDDDNDDEEDDEEDDDDDACEFDDGRDDDDGDGLGDEPPAGQEVIPQGIAINKITGVIDLRKTVNNGTFGATPVSGTSKLIRIYYRLNDASNKALNHIDVTVHWYATMSQVPASLLARLNDKNGATLRLATPSQPSLNPNVMSYMAYGRPRPPDAVLVGR